MEKIVKSSPDVLIREIIKNKYGSLEKACDKLNIGSRQALNNTLKRLSEREGTFKAFYKIMDELNYQIDFVAIPKIKDIFDDEKFKALMNAKKLKAASKLLDAAKASNEIDDFKYILYRNEINSQEEASEGRFRTVVNLDEDNLKLIMDFHPLMSFSEKLNLILRKESIGLNLFRSLEKNFKPTASSEEVQLIEELEELYNQGKVKKVYDIGIRSFLADEKKVWIELEDESLHDVTKFFPKEVLKKLKFKKNLQDLDFGKARMFEGTIISLSLTFEGNHLTWKNENLESLF